jgi:hypothetical protein
MYYHIIFLGISWMCYSVNVADWYVAFDLSWTIRWVLSYGTTKYSYVFWYRTLFYILCKPFLGILTGTPDKLLSNTWENPQLTPIFWRYLWLPTGPPDRAGTAPNTLVWAPKRDRTTSSWWATGKPCCSCSLFLSDRFVFKLNLSRIPKFWNTDVWIVSSVCKFEFQQIWRKQDCSRTDLHYIMFAFIYFVAIGSI